MAAPTEARPAMGTVIVGGRPLQVDLALQLLEREGLHALAGHEIGSPEWLQALIDGLCMLSSCDPMTGLVNRRQFEASLDGEIDRVARSGESAMLLLIDIDHFKRVNDTYGHGAGDAVIRAVGRTLQDCVRPMDTVARIGGEEFAAVLPNCPASFGEAVADRIRLAIESCRIEVARRVHLSVTASVGGAFAPRWVRSSARLWMERADQQLYRAKAAGRNRTCMELPPHSEVSNEERDMLFSTMSAFMPDTLDSTR
ncbi:GGDEF domain-containing protein [Sphaerotilus uruguayifluvii]|uniref:diguanylate cyclase n=1 Tax=Sphaerotilus uruguayifluvii TaxID=2735897 RepID=A0ABX2G972_9BURK|nr:GGDEF domain-containing protein [Leptothrix sp. C29]NRT57998.1 diguanylate cyclase (GGDEF)-like protein [Leptothrix sp. C29]